MSVRTPLWIPIAALAAALAAATPAHASGKNQIRAVDVVEKDGIASVRVRGAQAPTFTVYKLDRPTRVVIDVASATLDEAVRGAHESGLTWTPGAWAVSQISAQQLDDGGALVRVVVTLARPGRWDVKQDGDDVIVMVTPRDAPPAGDADAAAARAEATKAKQETATAKADAQKMRSEAEKSKADADRSKSEADQARTDAQQAQAEAARAKAAADQEAARAKAAQAAADAAVRDARSQKTDQAATQKMIDDARAEAARAKDAAVAAQKEAARTRAAAESEAIRAKQAAEAEAARAKTAADAEAAAKSVAEAAAAKAQQEAAAAQADAARARQAAETEAARAKASQAAADAAMRDAQQQKADTVAAKKMIDDARAEAARAKDAAAAAQAEAERLRAEAERARADADRARQDASAGAASAQKMIDDARAEAARAKDEAAQVRADSDRQVQDAKAQLARVEADEKAAAAREAAAKDAQAAADRERAAAAAAVKVAQAERDRAKRDAAAAAKADHDKLDGAAKDAEDRLARAEAAAKDAEARRAQAEDAARAAKSDADGARAVVADADAKRRAAIAATKAAEDSRALAEKGLADAEQKTQQAEAARAAAEQQRKAAEQAAADATARAQRADQARADEEAAAHAAATARADAEKKRDEAARAAADLEKSIAAEKAAAADAQARADEAARARAAADDAERHRASQKDIDAARAAADKLDARRADADQVLASKQAEVDRRQKEVADLAAARDGAAADLARLKVAADQARASRQDEEKQLAALEARRAAAEKELVRLEAQRKAAQAALIAAQKAAPAPVIASAPAAAPAPAPAAAPAPAPAVRTTAIKNVGFDHDDTASQVVIDLAGDVQPQVVSTTDRRAELVLDNVDLPVRLERTLDTSRFAGPIQSVSSFRDLKHPGRVRVIVDLAQPATPTLAHSGNTWRWQFASAAPATVAKATKAPRSMPPPVVAGYGASSTPIAQTTVAQVAPQPGKRKIYHGATIDLDTKDAPIHDLLRAISDVARINIVIPEDITARVTVRLKRVPWDQALEVILESKGLWYRRDGNLIRVAPRKELDAEDEAEAARRAALAGSEKPDTDVLTLNYASAAELLPKLEPMLSPKGKLEVDDRTNSLIVYDVRLNRRDIQQLALQLDTQTPQISIEARVVEASSNFKREFGIQWGGNASASAQGGNATGLVFPSSVGLSGGADDKNTVTSGVNAVPSDFAVNLPAAGVGNDEGGALGLSLGSVGGNFNINLRLSALEDSGTVRIVSSPKVTVLNNTEATISQGTRIPIQVVSAAGTQTQFVNAELSLVVKPYVSQRDCSIAMDLHVTKNEPDFVHTGARGDPTILSKEAKTRLLVADGETSVLGGIYTSNKGISYNKVPYLGDIPVFGWLFKRRVETDNRTELLIFITPKITNKAFLRCQ